MRNILTAMLTTGGSSRLFSLSTLVLDEHERQDYIIQHMHPSRVYLEPCLSFLGEVMFPVKFSDHGLLLVGSDQLNTAIGHNISIKRLYRVNRSVPSDSSTPSYPMPICTVCHLAP